MSRGVSILKGQRALALVLLAVAPPGCAFLFDTDTLARDAGTATQDAAAALDTGSKADRGLDALPPDGSMHDAQTEDARDSGSDTEVGADASPPSCAPGGPGMTDCAGSESCCTSFDVTGGTFDRSYDGVTYTDSGYPASVSSFRLDKYEITVGRFRQFVNAVVMGWKPAAGSGIHTYLNGGQGLTATGGGFEMGWDATDWNAYLATTSTTWTSNLLCDVSKPDYQTWTESPTGDNEYKPINCENWYEAYAFCIWDGGFLPSEAEWNYAAADGGGDGGQRAYPWSVPSTSTTIDCGYANYFSNADGGPKCLDTIPNNVGTDPMGNGAFGQADLAGNLAEWILDAYATPYFNPCNDCTNMSPAASRVVRGGNFLNTSPGLLVSNRGSDAPSSRAVDHGARCARAP